MLTISIKASILIDQQHVTNPNMRVFISPEEALVRLMAYHVYQHPHTDSRVFIPSHVEQKLTNEALMKRMDVLHHRFEEFTRIEGAVSLFCLRGAADRARKKEWCVISSLQISCAWARMYIMREYILDYFL